MNFIYIKKIKNYALIIFIIASYILSNNIYSQNVDFTIANFPGKKQELKTALKNIKKGDNMCKISTKMCANAIDYYLKAYNFNPKNAELNYKIGKSYLNTIQKNKSLTYFELAYNLNPNIAPDITYLLAQSYQLDMQFNKAIEKYNEFRNSLSPNMLAIYNDDIEKRIQECQNGKELIAKPIKIFVDNLGNTVNSIYPDYCPIVNADESALIFTSRRNTVIGGKKAPIDNSYYEDIYISYKINDVWGIPRNLGKPINTKLHDATVGFSPDGQYLYIYRGDNGGDIYECKLEGDKWSKPKKLSKEINTKYHETSASFSYDNKKIYFVSDKPGGYGGSDIYVSEKNENGEWEEAVNLGPVINTPYNEEGVFMHPDGKTLYFSSKGHKTMGGYDIFKSTYENGQWSEPENLGYPINTPDDDVFFSISADGKHAYYSSGAANGYGSLDIYLITIIGKEKPVVSNTEDNLIASFLKPIKETVMQEKITPQSPQLTLLKGIITDSKTNNPMKANIEVYDVDEGTLIANLESNSKTGKYLVSLPSGRNYGITVKSEGYLFHSENFNIPPDALYNEITKDIKLNPVEVGSTIVLRNIFYDFDKYDLRPESKVELENIYSLMMQYPTMVIEISSHTDSYGTDEYNQVLSEKRANSVVEYLANKGINRNRLIAKGYGETLPIAPNDTDEGRQLNRRSEFKIISK
ncbi:MAG TPA: OmpA family protein [Bacteroidales bacterium]|nr:OmpA family protein [Bacteroidales bacterium]